MNCREYVSRLIVHATNIHTGGGKSLLSALLQVSIIDLPVVAILDSRMPLPEGVPENIEIHFTSPSIWQRLKAEWWLAQNVQSQDTVLCFGNLPPLFSLRGHTVVFVQNRYLIDGVTLNGFPFSVRLRLALERLWLSGKMTNADEFIVQTPTMKRLLEIKTRGRVPVRVLPFVSDPKGYARSVLQSKVQKENDFDFVYVASGEPHKNHRRLVEAWCLLAGEGLFPSLCLTLDEAQFAGLCQEVEAMHQQYGLKVENAGGLSHQDVLSLYKRAGAAIYPSTFESFGLPLIEARQAGMPVLASELDYVRDVLDPEQSFDPDSPLSIARAVKRFMNVNEQSLPLLDASQFVASVFKKDRQ